MKARRPRSPSPVIPLSPPVHSELRDAIVQTELPVAAVVLETEHPSASTTVPASAPLPPRSPPQPIVQLTYDVVTPLSPPSLPTATTTTTSVTSAPPPDDSTQSAESTDARASTLLSSLSDLKAQLQQLLEHRDTPLFKPLDSQSLFDSDDDEVVRQSSDEESTPDDAFERSFDSKSTTSTVASFGSLLSGGSGHSLLSAASLLSEPSDSEDIRISLDEPHQPSSTLQDELAKLQAEIQLQLQQAQHAMDLAAQLSSNRDESMSLSSDEE